MDTNEHTDIQSVADDILDTMPTPQPAAMEQFRAENAASDGAASVPDSADVDAAGVKWNPEIHATGVDGKGVKTAKGQWRQRRGMGGRSSVVGRSKAADVPLASENQAARAAGVACAHSLFMFGRMLGGEEWAPRKIEEKGTILLDEAKVMEQAWGDYFVATGKTDFPPGLALTIACSSYILPRFTMPMTKSRIQKAKEWIAHKYVSWKMRKDNRAPSTSEIGERNARREIEANRGRS